MLVNTQARIKKAVALYRDGSEKSVLSRAIPVPFPVAASPVARSVAPCPWAPNEGNSDSPVYLQLQGNVSSPLGADLGFSPHQQSCFWWAALCRLLQ